MTARGRKLLQRRGEHVLVRQRATENDGCCNKLYLNERSWQRLGSWRCNDGSQSFVDKHRLEQTQFACFKFGRCDAKEMEKGAARGMVTNDEQELDGELRWRWRLRRMKGNCRRRYGWRKERQGRRQPCDFKEKEDESWGLQLRWRRWWWI